MQTALNLKQRLASRTQCRYEAHPLDHHSSEWPRQTGRIVAIFCVARGLSEWRKDVLIILVLLCRSPAEFEKALTLREQLLVKSAAAAEGQGDEKGYEPVGSLDHLLPGTYYLQGIDAMYRRSYGLKA
jgi:hypothetical protein